MYLHLAIRQHSANAKCQRVFVLALPGLYHFVPYVSYRSTLVCPGCGHQSDKLEPFLFVSLPIPTGATSTSSPGDRGRTDCRRPSLAVYVIVVRQQLAASSRHQPAVRHGFQLLPSRRSTVARLRRLIKDRTGIPHRKVRCTDNNLISTIIKTTSVCDGDARSVGGGRGWLAGDTDGLTGWPVTVGVVYVGVVDTRYRAILLHFLSYRSQKGFIQLT